MMGTTAVFQVVSILYTLTITIIDEDTLQLYERDRLDLHAYVIYDQVWYSTFALHRATS